MASMTEREHNESLAAYREYLAGWQAENKDDKPIVYRDWLRVFDVRA